MKKPSRGSRRSDPGIEDPGNARWDDAILVWNGLVDRTERHADSRAGRAQLVDNDPEWKQTMHSSGDASRTQLERGAIPTNR